MKLYRRMRKRLAKKLLRFRWEQLNFARILKPGDLISTCRGYNERIVQLDPCWVRREVWVNRNVLRHGSYIIDFDIWTDGGGVCSLIHCCTIPTETREEIIEFWRDLDPDYIEGERTLAIYQAVVAGRDVFNANGELVEQFRNNPHESPRATRQSGKVDKG